MKQRKVPMRMCIGCRIMKPKKELLRIVKSPEGDISIDLKGKASGRGAYLCQDITCLEKTAKNKLLEHTFNQKIDPSIYEQLKRELNIIGNIG